jgi:hypothetical protein
MSPDPAKSKTADVLFDAFFSAAIGGSIVGLFFLVSDAISAEVFWTPSLLGNVIFGGLAASEVSAVRLDMVAIFTVFHLVAFAALGLSISLFVHAVPHFSDRAGLVAVILLLALQGGFFALDALAAPGIVKELGFLQVLFANTITAGGMAYFLRRSHRICAHGDPMFGSSSAEAETEAFA